MSFVTLDGTRLDLNLKRELTIVNDLISVILETEWRASFNDSEVADLLNQVRELEASDLSELDKIARIIYAYITILTSSIEKSAIKLKGQLNHELLGIIKTDNSALLSSANSSEYQEKHAKFRSIDSQLEAIAGLNIRLARKLGYLYELANGNYSNYIEGLRIFSNRITELVNEAAAERGLTDVINLSKITRDFEKLGIKIQQYRVIHYLMHFGLIQRPEDWSKLTQIDIDNSGFIAWYQTNIHPLSKGQRKEYLEKNSALYRAIEDIRIEKEIFSLDQINGASWEKSKGTFAFTYTKRNVEEWLKDLLKDQTLDTQLRMSIDLWTHLRNSHIAVSETSIGKSYSFTLEGLVEIVNYFRREKGLLGITKEDVLREEVSKSIEEFADARILNEANIKLEYLLKNTHFIMIEGKDPQTIISTADNETSSAFHHISSLISDGVKTKTITVLDDGEGMLDPKRANRVIIEFLNKLFQGKISAESIEKNYSGYEAFKFLGEAFFALKDNREAKMKLISILTLMLPDGFIPVAFREG